MNKQTPTDPITIITPISFMNIFFLDYSNISIGLVKRACDMAITTEITIVKINPDLIIKKF
jgi:hypothetical protein